MSESLRLLEKLKPFPEPVAEPFFVAVCGLPGTGKSYLCHRLVEKIPAVIVESDALRKMLFSPPRYSVEENHYLFRCIYLIVERLLGKSIPVILDATNLSEKNRKYLYSISERLGVNLIMVRTSAPQELVRQRLKSRHTDTNNMSAVDWNIYLKMKLAEDKIRRKHYTADTSQDISLIIDKIGHEVLR